jgi:hypothetical protein
MNDQTENGGRRRAKGRTLAEFEPLTPAEKLLVESCAMGSPAVVGNERPANSTDNGRLRASFVRFLTLGGDGAAPVHEKGVQLQGAWIDGDLNLEACEVTVPIVLTSCCLDGRLILFRADVRDLYLDGTHVQDIFADGLRCRGDTFLRHGFFAREGVRLPGAQISGNLELVGSRVEEKAGDALHCERTTIGGDVVFGDGFSALGMVSFRDARIGANVSCAGGNFDGLAAYPLAFDGADVRGNLHLGPNFSAKGVVRIMRARIGGDLVCSGGNFVGANGISLALDDTDVGGNVFFDSGFRASGTVRLPRAKIGAALVCNDSSFTAEDGVSLAMRDAKIEGPMFFRRIKGAAKQIQLSGAHVGSLDDDLESWNAASSLQLDGFRYHGIGSSASTNGKSRVAWLLRQSPEHLAAEFKPQPWNQLIKVLRESENTEDARVVAIEKQRRLRKARKITGVLAILHFIFGILAGYGYRPWRLLGIVVAVALACGAVYSFAARYGVMAPTNPRIYDDAKFDSCRPERSGNWITCAKMPREYTTFNPWLYSFDLILAPVDLQQEKDWAPMVVQPCAKAVAAICVHPAQARGDETPATAAAFWPLGLIVRVIAWCEILFGWIAGLYLIAIVSVIATNE